MAPIAERPVAVDETGGGGDRHQADDHAVDAAEEGRLLGGRSACRVKIQMSRAGAVARLVLSTAAAASAPAK